MFLCFLFVCLFVFFFVFFFISDENSNYTHAWLIINKLDKDHIIDLILL